MAGTIQDLRVNVSLPVSQLLLPLQQLRDGRNEDMQQRLVSHIGAWDTMGNTDTAQRKGIWLSLEAVLLDTSPPSRLVKRA